LPVFNHFADVAFDAIFRGAGGASSSAVSALDAQQ